MERTDRPISQSQRGGGRERGGRQKKQECNLKKKKVTNIFKRFKIKMLVCKCHDIFLILVIIQWDLLLLSAAVSASLDPLLIKNTVWSNGEMIHIPTNGVTLSYLSTSNGPRKVKI